MKKVVTLLLLLTILYGCGLHKSAVMVSYCHNDLEEVLSKVDEYSIYDYLTPLNGKCDHEVLVAAHYRLFIPSMRKIKHLYRSTNWTDRCFLYSRNRGIAVFQDIRESDRIFPVGLTSVSEEFVEDQLAFFSNDIWTKVLGKRSHYLFVSGEIRLLMFNLTNDDYHEFVETPMESLKIKKHAEVIMD